MLHTSDNYDWGISSSKLNWLKSSKGYHTDSGDVTLWMFKSSTDRNCVSYVVYTEMKFFSVFLLDWGSESTSKYKYLRNRMW